MLSDLPVQKARVIVEFRIIHDAQSFAAQAQDGGAQADLGAVIFRKEKIFGACAQAGADNAV